MKIGKYFVQPLNVKKLGCSKGVLHMEAMNFWLDILKSLEKCIFLTIFEKFYRI